MIFETPSFQDHELIFTFLLVIMCSLNVALYFNNFPLVLLVYAKQYFAGWGGGGSQLSLRNLSPLFLLFVQAGKQCGRDECVTFTGEVSLGCLALELGIREWA